MKNAYNFGIYNLDGIEKSKFVLKSWPNMVSGYFVLAYLCEARTSIFCR